MSTFLYIIVGSMVLIILLSIIGRIRMWNNIENGEEVTVSHKDGWEQLDVIVRKTDDELFLPNTAAIVTKWQFVFGDMPFDIHRRLDD